MQNNLTRQYHVVAVVRGFLQVLTEAGSFTPHKDRAVLFDGREDAFEAARHARGLVVDASDPIFVGNRRINLDHGDV